MSIGQIKAPYLALNSLIQYCHINGHSSSMQKINCGVPQGSMIGPILFLILINDIAKSFFSPFCM